MDKIWEIHYKLPNKVDFSYFRKGDLDMLKRLLLSFMVLSFAVLPAAFATSAFAQGNYELVLADFNTGDKPNNVGGDFGSWDKDPEDDTQGTHIAFEPEDAIGDPNGYSLRLEYDVDSPNPAYNGFWMKLVGEDFSNFNTLNFFIRGDGRSGFTKRLKLELKDQSNKPSPYIISGVTDEWQQFSIPFEKFKRIADWTSMNEFVIVFDDINSRPKAGTIYLDHISVTKE